MRTTTRPGRRAALVVALGATAALALAGCSSGQANAATSSSPDCAKTAPTLTVDATGKASTTPNLLTVDVGITVHGATATAALNDANTQATHLSSALQAAGVKAADVQTTSFSVQPVTNQEGTITAYTVSNTVVAKLHDLAHAGAVLDAASRSAGNAIRVNGISFSVDDTTAVDGTARANAIRTAKAHARSMAAASGETITGVCSISDAGASTVHSQVAFGTATAAGPAQTVPLHPGTQQATAQVTVVYALRSS